MDPKEALERESVMMGRKVTLIRANKAVFRDAQDVEHELMLLIYDASTKEHPQTRWAVYIDGRGTNSSIV